MVLLFLLGLAAMSSAHLGWKVFCVFPPQPFHDLLSEDCTAGWPTWGGRIPASEKNGRRESFVWCWQPLACCDVFALSAPDSRLPSLNVSQHPGLIAVSALPFWPAQWGLYANPGMFSIAATVSTGPCMASVFVFLPPAPIWYSLFMHIHLPSDVTVCDVSDVFMC